MRLHVRYKLEVTFGACQILLNQIVNLYFLFYISIGCKFCRFRYFSVEYFVFSIHTDRIEIREGKTSGSDFIFL